MVVNYVAVLVAAIVGWLVGAIWYGALSKQWMAALGWSAADMLGPDGKRALPVKPMVLAFLCQIVMALLLAGLIAHIGPPDILHGIVSGVLVWVGFVITTIAVNNAFQRRPWALTAIDGGHWLAVLVLQGIVLGVFG
jgi:hypothetical protein